MIGTFVNEFGATESKYEATPGGVSYNEICTLCEYERTAEKYRRLASEWQRRADAIRLTREAKK